MTQLKTMNLGGAALGAVNQGSSNGGALQVINGRGTAVGGIELVRPADTTQYTIGDGVGVNLAITGATNASPIVVTSATHNLADGDPVTISSVGGNTNANGNFYAKVTGYSATTFALYSDFALTLPVAGNSAYTSGGALARAWRFPLFVQVPGGGAYITKVLLKSSNQASTLQCRAHLFALPTTAPPTIPLDNAVWNPLYATDHWLGSVDLSALSCPGSAPSGAAAVAEWLGQIKLIVPTGQQDILVILQALTASTPASASGNKLYLVGD